MANHEGDTVWMITDPTHKSTIADILFETTASKFVSQVEGGLSREDNPAIFAKKEDAEREAKIRLGAKEAARVFARTAREIEDKKVVVQITNHEGGVLDGFTVEL